MKASILLTPLAFGQGFAMGWDPPSDGGSYYPDSGFQDPYSGHQDPYSGHEDPYSGHQSPSYYPDASQPRCVPFMIDEQDSGHDICLTSIDGMLKKVTIEFPRRPDYEYKKVYFQWGCTEPQSRSLSLYPYQSPDTGCWISSDRHYAQCEIYPTPEQCFNCDYEPFIVTHAEMTRLLDNQNQVGSGLGECIKDQYGGCPKWWMWWKVKLLCGQGGQQVTSRSSNMLTASPTAQPVFNPAGGSEQCGGEGWKGATECVDQHTCHPVNGTYHVCKYNGADAQDEGGQCGGTNWWGKNTCGQEQECYGWKPEYHVCRSSKVCSGRSSQCGGKHSDGRLWWGPSKCPDNTDCYAKDDFFHGCRSTEVQVADGQCGGKDPATQDFWWGPYKCPSGFNCRATSSDLSECKEVEAATTAAAPQANQVGGGQCGGISWTGPTTCEPGFTCRKYTDRWHECRPEAEQGPQCGGQGWTGGGSCPNGQICRKFTNWWSQCIDYTDGNGAQCGGSGWTGDNTCPIGYGCSKFTDYYHQCVVDSKMNRMQCGGNGWDGSTTCPDNHSCKQFTEWYSQCIANDQLAQYEVGAMAAVEPYVMVCTAEP
ncbi:putative polysaccharide-binding protein [Zalerion maritima]|uniref:Polysaccharide-binding protein n=1 Tax=Zalerion maritima TaxID=339359 RepID=A0AAD5WQZ1_9PEZI|nr:putative polysaccharide-binding protein [Zalerion maritima]